MPRPTVGAFALAASLLLSVLAVPAPAHAEPVGHTSWQMRSDGHYVSSGERSYTPETASISASGTPSRVTVNVAGGGEWWDADFAAPEGQQLTAGTTYAGARRFPFQAPGEPGLDVSGSGRGCNQVWGDFTVHEATYDEAGALTAFAVTFEHRCESESSTPLYGSIAWQATSPARPAQPLVSIEALGRKHAFMDRVVVEARVSHDSPIRELSIYAEPHGQERRLVRVDTVASNGRMSVRIRVTRATTFTAELDGQDHYDDVSASTALTVAAKVTATMQDPNRRDRRFAYYRADRRAVLLGKVGPNHAGDCLYFQIEFKVGGRWRYRSETDCVRMSSESRAGAYLDGNPDLVDRKIRNRAVWRGDAANTPDKSRWRYFKFYAVRGSRPAARPATSASLAEHHAPSALR
ncbi:hypothetical protein ACFP3Q_01225 [Nocardioides sp. GCM10027113]|uniref:hypothetical protein n=1 Tax=unclassified Nocardioides TaxID=2615069 RepID=UPI00360DE74F